VRRPQERKYLIIRGVGNKVVEETVSAGDLAQIVKKEYDLVICKATGTMVVTSPSGKRITYEGKWPRMGETSLDVLEALLINGNEYLKPSELADLTGNRNLKRNSALAARILAIRKTLHDKTEKYIQTQKTPGHYAVRWTGRPWIWIERMRD